MRGGASLDSLSALDVHTQVADGTALRTCSSTARVPTSRATRRPRSSPASGRMPFSQRSRSPALRAIQVSAMGSVRIRKRSSNTAAETMRATSSGSLMGPAALLTKDDDEDPSIGVRDAQGCQQGHPNALVVVRDRQPLGESDDRVLGDRVGQVGVAGEDPGDRGRVQQVARFPFEHRRQHRADREHVGHDVDLPLLVPGVDFRVQGIAAGGDAGVGEEHVHRPVGGLGLGHQGVDIRFIADVAGDRHAADFVCHMACAVAVLVGHDHGRAEARELASGCRADAAGAGGDDGVLVS